MLHYCSLGINKCGARYVKGKKDLKNNKNSTGSCHKNCLRSATIVLVTCPDPMASFKSYDACDEHCRLLRKVSLEYICYSLVMEIVGKG